MSSSRPDSPVTELSASHRGELKWRRNKGTPAVSPSQSESIAVSSGLEYIAPSDASSKPRHFRELTTSIPEQHLSNYVSNTSVCPVHPPDILLSTPTLSGNTRIQISVSPETSRLASSVTGSMHRSSPPRPQAASSWSTTKRSFGSSDGQRPDQGFDFPHLPGSSQEAPARQEHRYLFGSSYRRSEAPPVYETPERTSAILPTYSSSTETPCSPPSAEPNEPSSMSTLASPVKSGPSKAISTSRVSSSIFPSPIKPSPEDGLTVKPCREVSRLTIGSGETAASIDGFSDARTQCCSVDRIKVEERVFDVHWKKEEASGLSSTLCQCPCLNCATCPLRVSHSGKLKEVSDSGSRRGDTDTFTGKHERSLWAAFKDAINRIIHLQASEDPARYCYDSLVIPSEPLPRPTQRLLEITELPFLILWVYLTYWCVIVSITATTAPSTVWLSALVASLLVGIGLNANAYKSVTVPRRRGSIRHHRHARALLELRKYGESIDAVEMKLDWGMIVRFFIIPFGVSSLSGLTNSNRERFLLVFPNELQYLLIAILCPAVVVILLALFRVLLLWKLRVRWSLQVLFLNGALVD